MFKKLLKGMAFLAVLSIVVIVFDKITRTGPQKKGNVRVSADLALFGATDAITGPGLMDRVADRMIRDKTKTDEPSFGGARNTAGIAPGGNIEDDSTETRRPPPGAPGGDGDSASDQDEESARARLRRIRMLEIERGERRMYGGGTDRLPAGAASSPAHSRPSRTRAPSDAEIAAELAGFVNKLKRRATDDATAQGVGSSLEEADRLSGDDGDIPILSLDGVDNRLEQSPALRALQQLNKDGASSLSMSRRNGMTDGSRDKAGKRFDGNEKTMDSIPIEEVSGAFGKKQIKTYTDGGGVRDLK